MNKPERVDAVITETHLKEVCQPGTTECCRYLTMGRNGFSCEKHTPEINKLLDARVAAGTIRATGDNCGGRLSI